MVKMRKILALLLALLTLGVLPLMSWGDGIETQAKSLILVEGSTGKVLYELNADESLPPASVTKIMTLLLVFEAIEEGKLRFEDPITVSEHKAVVVERPGFYHNLRRDNSVCDRACKPVERYPHSCNSLLCVSLPSGGRNRNNGLSF